MNPWQVSARCAAFLWYLNQPEHGKRVSDAKAFASREWRAFLPAAHEGYGRLLMRIARPPLESESIRVE